ncbi:hypothetical protein ACFVR2_25050 [Gottfriedia sp. NPDC057991]|uniref:hypothetical protein n=1 Tax=Gottfriedia sp. NPDC057991 TaxID=3346298 RepID=UPI0036DDE7D4
MNIKKKNRSSIDPLFYVNLYLIKNVLVEKDIQLFMFHKFPYGIECHPGNRFAFQVNALDSEYTLLQDNHLPQVYTFEVFMNWIRNLTKD